ncbi:MAG: methionyl-tRNA formyltransferase [Planctomycetes bacterium]|nr:methionyl-tRNA formyltransferase [Planctomycetota bacterium]
MKIVFAGTAEFGVPSLRRLVAEGLAPELVISQPDRPKGRRGTPTPPPLAAEAAALGLPLYQPQRLNRPEPRERIGALQPDVLVVIAYGQILKPKVLALPRLGCVNLHGSLLPRHRGASPVQAAILAADAETGVTVMCMDEGLDSGPLLLAGRTPIAGDDTGGTLHDRLSEMGAPLLVEALRGLDAGTIVPEPQDPAQITTCGLIDKRDGLIDWTSGATEIERRSRAYDPWPGGYTFATVRDRELRLVVERAEVVEPSDRAAGAVPGCVVHAEGDDLQVATGQGVLRLLRLKPAGKRAMVTAEFLRGYPLKPGEHLGSPSETPS